MRDRLPLPHVLGRVCYHPCERDCRRTELGGVLSVCRLRRFVFETEGWRC
jgi:NADPH-dependent glutamate synthase beta subunit-like oxidoreductase